MGPGWRERCGGSSPRWRRAKGNGPGQVTGKLAAAAAAAAKSLSHVRLCATP